MSVTMFFGLPGCGKTTLLTKFALDAVNSGKFENVYSNVHITVAGVTVIDNDDIGKYALRNCLLLIDEATIFADNRNFKTFDKGKVLYFLEHRHFRATIFLFTQQWDGVDRKIRTITDRVFYVYRHPVLPWWFSCYYRVPYDIIIPDPKTTPDKLGEIVQGYCKPNFFVRLFAKSIYRPKYYKYFDSYAEPLGFDELPSHIYTNFVEYDGYAFKSEKQLRRYKIKKFFDRFFKVVSK